MLRARSAQSSSVMDLPERLAAWRGTGNWVSVGNLGEQVTSLFLELQGYQVMGTQGDYLGMVLDVRGDGITAHPEDFIAINPEGRLMTVNSKAAVYPHSCRITQMVTCRHHVYHAGSARFRALHPGRTSCHRLKVVPMRRSSRSTYSTLSPRYSRSVMKGVSDG